MPLLITASCYCSFHVLFRVVIIHLVSLTARFPLHHNKHPYIYIYIYMKIACILDRCLFVEFCKNITKQCLCMCAMDVSVRVFVYVYVCI